jgi:hypothetical protein
MTALKPEEREWRRPVCWRVKDFADGWIYFETEDRARKEAERTGALVEPVYDL